MKFPLKVRQPLFEDDKGGGGGPDDKKDDKKGDEMPSWAKSMQTELAELKTKLAGNNKAPGAPQVIPKPEKQDKPEDQKQDQQDSKSSGGKKTGFLDWLLG